MDIFWILHWRVKIEVFQINGAEAGTFPGDDATEEDFDKFQGCGVGSNIPWEADHIPPNGDTGAIWVIFVWPHFADYLCMADLLFLVGRGLVEVNDDKRTSTRYTVGAWFWLRPSALAEGTKLI